MIFTSAANKNVRIAVNEKITELTATQNSYQARYARLDIAKKHHWIKIAKTMQDIGAIELTLNVLNKASAKKDIGSYLITSAYTYLDEEHGTTSEDLLYCLKDASL